MSFTVLDNERQGTSDSKYVERKDFQEYIMASDELDDHIDDSANIEIITAVLKKGKYKWLGLLQRQHHLFRNEVKRV